MPTADTYPNLLLALAVWREARGQPVAVKSAVKHVILNRAAHPTGPFHHCPDVVTNILAPFQFSSFNRNDPNAYLMPTPRNPEDWAAWLECCEVVDAADADPTEGANYYFSVDIKPPEWADPSRQTVQIGPIRFFKLYP